MADLKTNYVDDKLNASANQLRKYKQIKNDDGTVSFVDVTDYTATGTSFGANDINATNKAVNKNTADINSLNLKMDSANANISKKQDASTAITTSNIASWFSSHIKAKTAQITTTMSPYSYKEVTVPLNLTGNYIILSLEPYVVGEAMAHITNHFTDGKGNVMIDVSNLQATGTSTVNVGVWIRYIQL